MAKMPTLKRFAAPATPAGMLQGMRLSLPTLLPLFLFGSAFATLAAQKGLSLIEAAAMSAFVFAGASQFVAVEMWTHPLTASAIATMVLVTLSVNLRFMVLGAGIQPWLAGMPRSQLYPALLLMTDPGWLIAHRYRSDGGIDRAIFLGTGLAQWLIWIAAVLPGYFLGTLIAEPARYGLDLIMLTFFAAMMVPLWRGRRRALSWLVAGAVALVVAQLVEGWWFIVAGALAGSVSGGFIDDAADEA
jgi:4-azaleucine resistance transporter AzlC